MWGCRGRKDRGETEAGAIGVSLEKLRIRGSGKMSGEDEWGKEKENVFSFLSFYLVH